MAVFVGGAARMDRVNYVEYIQSSGTQWIDTGFKPNQNTRVVVDVQITSAPSSGENPTIFGCSDSAGTLYYRVVKGGSGSVLNYEYGKVWSLGWPMTNATWVQRRMIDANKASCTIDGSTQSYSAQSFQMPDSAALLCDNFGGTGRFFAKAKLYSCQIYDNGTLVRDMWPCYDPTGVACLFDKVTKTYFYNAGTGVFTAG